MEVTTQGPLPVASLLWQPRPGSWMLTAICKASLRLQPHSPRLLAEQSAPTTRAQRAADGSVERPCDHLPLKPHVDVLLVGPACLPGGEANPSARCRLAIANLNKSVAAQEGADLGLGPMTAESTTRRAWLRGQPWDPERWFRTPLAEDFDRRFFNAAPADQQLAHLHGNEMLYLEHLHPEHPRLQLQLPSLHLSAMVRRGSEAHSTALRCDTLLIDSGRRQLELTYKLDVPLRSADEAVHVEVHANGLPAVEATVATAPEVASSASSRESAPLPAAVLAAMQRGSEDVRETTDFQGFLEQAPASTPFAQVMALADAAAKGSQPEFGLPFMRQSDSDVQTGDESEAEPAVEGQPNVQAGSPWAAPSPTTPGMQPPMQVRPPDPLKPEQNADASIDCDSAVVPSVTNVSELNEGMLVAAATLPAHVPLQLIWYAKGDVGRVRSHADWSLILDALDEQHDDELDDPSYADEPGDLDDRREIFEVLARGLPTDPLLLSELFAAGAREGGKYAPPLVLLEGDLELPFDALASLRALHDAAAPFAEFDETLSNALDRCRGFLDTVQPPCAAEVCNSWDKRLRDAFGQVQSLVSPDYLDDQIERVLLAGRAYQLRDVLGDSQLRGLFTPARQLVGRSRHTVLPTYLPAKLAKQLPMFRSYKARMLAELLPREDQYESHPAALRLVALARELPKLDW